MEVLCSHCARYTMWVSRTFLQPGMSKCTMYLTISRELSLPRWRPVRHQFLPAPVLRRLATQIWYCLNWRSWWSSSPINCYSSFFRNGRNSPGGFRDIGGVRGANLCIMRTQQLKFLPFANQILKVADLICIGPPLLGAARGGCFVRALRYSKSNFMLSWWDTVVAKVTLIILGLRRTYILFDISKVFPQTSHLSWLYAGTIDCGEISLLFHRSRF